MCRVWHSLSLQRLADLRMQMRVAACVGTPWRCKWAVDGVSSPAGCVFLCVSVIAPLWTRASGDKWPTGDVSSSSKGGGCGGLSRLPSCLAPSSYRSASILFSSCQNSQLRIDWSLLHLIFTRSNNKAGAKRSCWQVESARMPLKTGVFIKSKAAVSRECWWDILQGGRELSGWKPHAGPLSGKNTESIILAKAAGASCYGMKTLKNMIQTRCIIRVIYCLECTGGKKHKFLSCGLWETCEIQTYQYVDVSGVTEQSNGRQAPLDASILTSHTCFYACRLLRTKGLRSQVIFQFEVNFLHCKQTRHPLMTDVWLMMVVSVCFFSVFECVFFWPEGFWLEHWAAKQFTFSWCLFFTRLVYKGLNVS